MHRFNKVIYLTYWTVAIHIMLSACTDFSQFDCFNNETGCASQTAGIEASQAGFTNYEMMSVAGSELRPENAQCSVDELNICETCDTNGNVELLLDDRRCERIECLDQYILEEDERMVRCVQTSRAALGDGLCYQRGICHTENTLCTVIDVSFAQQVYKSSCYTIIGCMGSTEPKLVRSQRPSCHQ